MSSSARQRPHRARRVSSALVPVLLLASLLSPNAARAQARGFEEYRVPIHTGAPDTQGGAYGTWAAGTGYKVSFDAEVSFYPLLGLDHPHNLPLRWTTVGVHAEGGEPVDLDEACGRVESSWRYTLERGSVRECYDVLVGGLEQSFRIEQRPAGEGDLVIRGRVRTELWAPERVPSVGPVVFRDAAGEAIVTYGEALAIDADGHRTPVATGYHDGELSLHVPAVWLADAAFPVLVDPLLTGRTLGAGGVPYEDAEIAHDEENDQSLVILARASSASDWDLLGLLVAEDGVAIQPHFSDLSASWSSRRASAVHVPGADRWAIAFERYFPVLDRTRIRVYLRDHGSNPVAGTVIQLDENLDRQNRFPQIASARGGLNFSSAFVTFQEDDTPTAQELVDSTVRGVFVTANTPAFGPVFQISPDTGSNDCEFPSVSRLVASSQDSWLVVWQQFNNTLAGDDWDVWGRLVAPNGTLSSALQIEGAANGTHAVHPKVDGNQGRFLLLRGELANLGRNHGDSFTALRTRRVDWPAGGSPSYPHPGGYAAQEPRGGLRLGAPNAHCLAFDAKTLSHWALAILRDGQQLEYLRVGFDLGVVERVVGENSLRRSVRGASLCHDPDRNSFPSFYATLEAPSNGQRYWREFTHANASSTVQGVACGAQIAATNRSGNDLPWAGSEFFAVEIRQGAPDAPTALLVAPAPAAIPFAGCHLRVDPATFFVLAAGVSDGNGDYRLDVPLPSRPLVTGDVAWQGVQLDPANGAILLTPGLVTAIR